MRQLENMAVLYCCNIAVRQHCQIGVPEFCSSQELSHGIGVVVQCLPTVRACCDVAVRKHCNIALPECGITPAL